MKALYLLVPAMLAASPAAAAPPPEATANEMARMLNDPKIAEQLGAVAQALSKALLDIRVGELQAAAEGRAPTDADRRRTVRSETRMSEREIEAKIAEARPAMQAGMKALAQALPAMMKGLEAASKEMERAMANAPRPDYPKR